MKKMRNVLAACLAVSAGIILACGAPRSAPMPMSAVASVDELQSVNGGIAQVLSYHPGMNRGGGLFAFQAGSAATADGCIVFAGGGGKGRWMRQLSGALDVTMCGAWWDGTHDDAEAVSRAVQLAAGLRVTLSLPGGTGKVCSSVRSARGVILRGQGMGNTGGDPAPSPTVVDGSCMKGGWVFDYVTPNGTASVEAPKYYDFEILTANNNQPGGCIRWNRPDGGFTDNASSQNYMMHPHAERIYCNQQTRLQIGLECSKCFDGDFSQNSISNGKYGIVLEGSDVMCIGCAGPNRIAYTTDSLIRLVSHGTFGNMDRIVGNEILYPSDIHQRYDSFIYDGARSSTIEGNHIEGLVSNGLSAIHVAGGFTHAIVNNDVDVALSVNHPIPHWLIAEGPFVNFRATNNGCAGCVLGPALFTNKGNMYNPIVPQIITHGGNAANADSGFPYNSGP
jgi:hypothetical protein